MGQIIGSSTVATNNTASYTVIDMAGPGVMGPTLINNYTVLQIPAYFRAVNFKSANMASFPRSVRLNGHDVPHKLDQLLKRAPNAYQSPTMLWRTWFFHHAHYANGFMEIERDTLNNPKALHVRAPELVSPFRWLEDDGSISGWYWVGGWSPHVAPAADMMHLSGTSADGLSGINPIWLHGETYERARLGDRFITRFLARGTMIRASVEIPATATEEQAQAIIDDIRRFRAQMRRKT